MIAPASRFKPAPSAPSAPGVPKGWDCDKAVTYLNTHALETSHGRCAEFVRKAIEAGGVVLQRHADAKNYGSSLRTVGFDSMGQLHGGFRRGDVAVIQPIPGHPHGHMTMFNGTIWISDFRQMHGLYPGPGYRAQRPSYSVFRYQANGGRILWDSAKPVATSNLA